MAFPRFLRSIGDDACIADIADLEAARGKAYHAADAASLPPQAFAAIPADRLAGLRLTFHPSVSLLQSRFPIVSLWQANQEAGDVALPQDAPGGGLDRAADAGGRGMEFAARRLCVFHRAAGGATMAEAAEAAMDAAPDFDLAVNLAVMIQANIVTGLVALVRSLDGAKRNPELCFAEFPDCASLHPGYEKSENSPFTNM